MTDKNLFSFLDSSFKRRIEQSPQQKDLLRDALGDLKGKKLRILDATAGLCRDALRLTYWGHEVWACEREKNLSDEIISRLEEARRDDFYKKWIYKLHYIPQSTEEFLTQWKGLGFEIIIIDPMFSIEGRTSLPKKELQLLKEKVSNEDNAIELLNFCWRFKAQKIVLKRPLKASFIGPRKPTHIYKGRAHRWDVYVNPN